MNKFDELFGELKLVFSGRGAGILDALLPFLVYVFANRMIGLSLALALSTGAAVLLLFLRLVKKQSITFALGGLGTSLLAALLAYIGGTEGGYYLPGFITGGLTVLACFVSVLLGRPLAAYSSHLTRRWPLAWYWHPRVRPAYTFVSWIWAAFFGLRTVGQWLTLESTSTAALYRVSTGWPALLLLLVATYVIGRRRLERLGGPSIDEFREGTPEPWAGQQTGF